MTREQILAVVLKHLSNAIDGVDAATLDQAKSMKEYGANSLDIVEVVSASMRELKLKVPRSELNGIGNIGGLVDLLYRVQQEKQAAQV